METEGIKALPIIASLAAALYFDHTARVVRDHEFGISVTINRVPSASDLVVLEGMRLRYNPALRMLFLKDLG